MFMDLLWVDLQLYSYLVFTHLRAQSIVFIEKELLPMPGYEVIGEEEKAEILDLFDNGSILFRHGFDSLRNNCYKVREFESSFANARFQICSCC